MQSSVSTITNAELATLSFPYNSTCLSLRKKIETVKVVLLCKGTF